MGFLRTLSHCSSPCTPYLNSLKKIILSRICFTLAMQPTTNGDGGNDEEFLSIDEYLCGTDKGPELYFDLDENPTIDSPNSTQTPADDSTRESVREGAVDFSGRLGFIDQSRIDAQIALSILQQDGPGFDVKAALDN